MKKQVTLLTKTRDIAIGFFGWLLFLNLYFLALLEGAYSLISEPSSSIFFFGLPTIVLPIVFFARKQVWLGIGVVAAVLINAGMWLGFALMNEGLSSVPIVEVIQVLLLPFPLGFTLFIG